ncbi:CbtB domain-containing protein [Actinomadura parmotrematis]|uniref:CbtB-domain containing protein n=1 Tax=Actinomadura parmotrematis TaxID=2864039 RepID=A0ABS7FXV7_9ACTN|nr:CbtB domain-containing protein [Actinomadura parmotrematis]MBW8484509.1 CbtB-domain containing protein [Actinomadura parmotrematis]
MAPSTASPAAPARPAAPVGVPLRDIVPWAVLALVLGAVLIYFVGAEQGATSLISGTWVHEFTHDGRHLLGFPCH